MKVLEHCLVACNQGEMKMAYIWTPNFYIDSYNNILTPNRLGVQTISEISPTNAAYTC